MTNDVERARTYSRTKDRIALTGTAISLATSAGFVCSGLAGIVNRRLLPTESPTITQRVRYNVALSFLSTLAGLPLRYYSSYVVERRYGLSTQSRAAWAGDVAKGVAIGLPLESAVVEGVYAVLRRWPKQWWLISSGAVIPLSAVLAHLFPVLIAPRFNRYEPLRNRDLAARLTDLTARAGVPVADVMQMDMSRRTTKANAFFTGIGRTKRIVLADTMLDTFTPDEIEGVVAHEAGHQVHGDIWRAIMLSAGITLAIAKTVDTFARGVLSRRPDLVGTSNLTDIRSLPVMALVMAVSGTTIGPLQLAYSRRMERKADRFAMRLTRNPRAYAAAMRKLGTQNLADPNPPRWVVLMLHSHPPLAERISNAQAAEYNQVEGIM